MKKSFPTPDPISARLRVPSGEITVETDAAGETTVELVPASDQAEELLDRARIEMEGNELLVEVPDHARSGRAELLLRVRCPSGSAMSVRAASADVGLRGRYGRVEVKTASGDVRVGDADEEMVIATASGDVDLGRSRGRVAVTSASGDVRVERAGAGLKASLVSGDLEVHEVEGGAELRTTSGDLVLESVGSGPLRAETVSGDVSVRVRSGLDVWMDVNSVSGELSSELEPLEVPPENRERLAELRIKTVSGDVSIGSRTSP